MTTFRRAAAFGLAFLGLIPVLEASLAFSPASPRAGDVVTFVLSPSVSPLAPSRGIAWDFGDGTSQTTTTTQLTITHIYAGAGAYSVRATYYLSTSSALIPTTDGTTVTVMPALPKSIAFLPRQPNTCETVTFQASGFLSASLRWEFGDGTVVASGSSVQTHAYLSPGTYVVQVYESGAGSPGATAVVTAANRRSITASPLPAKTGVLLAFQAAGFVTPCIKWDFGDGTIAAAGAAAASHVYKNPGSYLVTAADDCGNAVCGATLRIPVIASQGPLAPFAVTYVRLRFDNGTTNILVGKGTAGVAAYADLKFEGTGMIQVEWRVDGIPVRTDAMSLSFADRITLNSGTLPGLPTEILGQLGNWEYIASVSGGRMLKGRLPILEHEGAEC